jgi:hypothetical protein
MASSWQWLRDLGGFRMKRRHLDNIYFRVMRDGRAQNICWTDLIWEDRVEFMRKHNNAGWLLDMINRMNELAYLLSDLSPLARVQPIVLPEERQVSLTWLRNALVKITAEIRMAAEECNIEKEVQ